MNTTLEKQLADKKVAEQFVRDISVGGGITFDVDDVENSGEILKTTKMKQAVETTIDNPVEACDNYTADVVQTGGQNSLMDAANIAYDRHLPLILSPDHIWLTIAQGLARHIENNAEELRHHFVKHKGKALIEIRRDSFIRKSPENPWENTWPEFSERIKEHIGDDTHSLILSNFSTTGPVEMAASEITLMDAMHSYFEYGVTTCCGIPKVTIEGNKEDYEKILDKIDRIEQYGLDWWCPTLRTIVGEFVNAFDGKINIPHWKALYKEDGGSGGPYISGWMTRMYPYLRSKEYERDTKGRVVNQTVHHKRKNNLVGQPWTGKDERWGHGLSNKCIPVSYSAVPFNWYYYGAKYDYEFVGGMVAVEQFRGAECAVRPRIGWAVREKKAA